MRDPHKNDDNPIRDFARNHPSQLRASLLALFVFILISIMPRLLVNVEPVMLQHLPVSPILQSSEESETKVAGRSITNENRTARSKTKSFQTEKSKPNAWSSHTKDDLTEPDLKLKDVDPNNVDINVLVRMGLPTFVAKNWVKYIDAGGRYYDRNDISKVYGMTEDLLTKVEGHIKWPEGKPSSGVHYKEVKVDINRADADEWARLRGIGPVLSARIIKFRDLLGGFISIDQVRETYGISDSLFLAIRPSLTHSRDSMKKLNINALTEKELAAHPYIDYKTARILTLYRKEHGPYIHPGDLLKTHVVDSQLIEKLTPYLTL